jgi:C-terminal processing protease CtpA/Prc
MKNFLLFAVAIFYFQLSVYPQIVTEQTQEPIFFNVRSHDPNIQELPVRSFYQSKSDWQYIIDTTWGPGLPLAQKRQIFNAYVAKLEEKFDGFLSLGFTDTSWNSFKQHYYSKIDSNTSRGRFSAIMYYFSSHLQDGHTYAYDKGVVETPLNPGIPVLIFGHKFSLKHFGAVTTVLENSTVLVLRVVENHPLNLEPGDIILGYEGVMWKDIVPELIEAELPAFGGRTGVVWGCGGTTGSQSSFNSAIHITAGMNLNIPDMLNNEQLEIPNIPFPAYWNGEIVTYGILPNSNIGYVYVFSMWPETAGDLQFYEAISALQNTEGLIIDMRWSEGGASLWHSAFGILRNEVKYTMDDVFRCSPTNWSLCPANYSADYIIAGSPPDQYESPIAVLVGPACFSMGDVNAYRLRYLSTVRIFGKPTAANLGWNERITNFPDWLLRYSKADMFHLHEPGVYLNRKEFPIDFPIWFNQSNVANGYDTIVEEALEWMDNLVYGHNVVVDINHGLPGIDTITVSATIENPNLHNIQSQIFIQDLNNNLIDSLELFETEGSEWQGKWLVSNYEEFFKLSIKATDQSNGESFTIENVNRITTAGPIVIDSLEISYFPSTDRYHVKPHIKNEGQTLTLENLSISMFSDDTTITAIAGNLIVNSIDPGEIIIHPAHFYVQVDSNFSGDFTFNFEVKKDNWRYWKDTYPDSIISYAAHEITLPLSYILHQNYPNPFNPSTTIKYGIPERTFVELRIYDIIGREVEMLVNEEQDAGYYDVSFKASALSSGVYLYHLRAGDFIETKKMVLMK